MKILLSVVVAFVFLPFFSVRADATIGQKEATEKILKTYRKTVAARDDSWELCEAVLRSPRAKARMCEMLKQDPEGRRLLGLQ